MDNKTEFIATLEQDLMSKENKILTLETFVTEMRQKIRSDFIYLFILIQDLNYLLLYRKIRHIYIFFIKIISLLLSPFVTSSKLVNQNKKRYFSYIFISRDLLLAFHIIYKIQSYFEFIHLYVNLHGTVFSNKPSLKPV